MNRPGFSAAAAAAAMAAFAATHALAAPIGATTGAQDGVNVRGEFTVTNKTGEEANDLHLTLRAKEAGNEINGVRPNEAGDFQDYESSAPGGKSVRLEFETGDIADDETITVDIDLWLKFRNSLYVEDIVLTKDGNKIGEVNIDNGWRVDQPREGGAGGGGAGNIGGGGQGGQEGGGGGGFWQHWIYIENTGDKAALVDNFKLLASMTRYDDLSDDVPWHLVDPIALGGAQSLDPGEILAYAFETVGSYKSGHVYLRYDFIDDATVMIGDHPVEEVPLPATIPLLATGLAGLLLLRSRA